jgi:hypothetical protein
VLLRRGAVECKRRQEEEAGGVECKRRQEEEAGGVADAARMTLVSSRRAAAPRAISSK